MANPESKRTAALPSCLTDILKGDDAARTVKEAANLIMHEMKAIHGGIWSVHVDHSVGYVLVRTHGALPDGGAK